MSLTQYFEIITYGDRLDSVNMSTGQRKVFCVLAIFVVVIEHKDCSEHMLMVSAV